MIDFFLVIVGFQEVFLDISEAPFVLDFYYQYKTQSIQQRRTDIYLLHTGWRDSVEWEEARQWFVKAWTLALSKLQNYVKDTEREKH